jgi:hypothetical protein
MSVADDIAARIVALSLGTAVGTDIFIGTKAKVPSGPGDDGPLISLVDTGGTGAIRSHDGRYPRPSCQVSVRARTASAARAKAEALHAALADKFNVTMGSTFYLSVIAVQETMDMPADSMGRARFGFNLNTLTRA